MPANVVLIVGESGSGKSTAIENLPASETFIINISSKDLPFRGWKRNYTEVTKDNPNGNMVYTDNADAVVKTLEYVKNRPEIKYIIVDDSQYVAVNEYMRRARETGSN
jgi:adenylate kinase family enzyme